MMVLNRVVQKEDQDAIARLIVGNIFKITQGRVLKLHQRLPICLRHSVKEYRIEMFHHSNDHDIWFGVSPKIVQHMSEYDLLVGDYIYSNNSDENDAIQEYIQSRVPLYYMISSFEYAEDFYPGFHKFVIVSYDDLFERDDSLLQRSRVNKIFIITCDLELIIDVELQQFFSSNDFDLQNLEWDNIENAVNNIKFPKSITKLTIVGRYLTTIRDYCLRGTKLTSVKLPKSVTSIGLCFLAASPDLINFKIPSNVQTIGNGFLNYCKNIVTISIPDSVTTIGASFLLMCSSITNVTIPVNVTTIGNNFLMGDINVTTITISNSVTTIGDCFLMGCSNLTTITLPNSVTKIGISFLNRCVNLRSITIPHSVTIPEGSLSGCTGVSLVRNTGITNNINDSNSSSNIVSHVSSNTAADKQDNKKRSRLDFETIDSK
jgi:hypothetical protein